jgi:DNA-binding MarR family transcriptional regulator
LFLPLLYIQILVLIFDAASRAVRLEDEIKQKSFPSPYHRVVVNIMFTGNWVQKQLSAQLRPFGLSLQQHNVLRILRGQHPKPSTLGLIQERMLDRMSNATRLVDKLIEKGLVDRCQCPENRRKVDIVITRAGLDLLQQTDALLRQIPDQYAHLSAEEASMLSNLLDKMRA